MYLPRSMTYTGILQAKIKSQAETIEDLKADCEHLRKVIRSDQRSSGATIERLEAERGGDELRITEQEAHIARLEAENEIAVRVAASCDHNILDVRRELAALKAQARKMVKSVTRMERGRDMRKDTESTVTLMGSVVGRVCDEARALAKLLGDDDGE